MNPIKNIFLLATVAATLLSPIPGSALGQENPIVLRGGRLVTVSQDVIEEGILLVRGGVIEAVGREVPIPDDARIIDVMGKVVLPGFIDGFTHLGTAELASFGADDDEATDVLTPHLRITDALNPDNRFIARAKESGTTTVLSAPGEGNLMTGQSALIRLTGSTAEDMTVVFPVAVHVTLGEAPKLRYGTKGSMPMTRMGAAALLRQTFIDAIAYADKIDEYEEKAARHERSKGKDDSGPVPPDTDFKLQALVPVVRGDLPLMVSADRYDDILTALRIGAEFGLKLILNHGAEAYRLAETLSSKNIPVIVGPLAYRDLKLEAMKSTRETAALLSKGGVKIAFQTGSIQNVSSLLAEARLALANGLPYEEALKALTLYPAQIFGVEERLGSIEPGKSATLVVLDKDPLHHLAQVEMVLISGEIVFEHHP